MPLTLCHLSRGSRIVLLDFYWHLIHPWSFVVQFGLPDHLMSPVLSGTSSVSIQDFSLIENTCVVSILLVEIILFKMILQNHLWFWEVELSFISNMTCCTDNFYCCFNELLFVISFFSSQSQSKTSYTGHISLIRTHVLDLMFGKWSQNLCGLLFRKCCFFFFFFA